jgi:two-component system, LytTR family, sensor kinase
METKIPAKKLFQIAARSSTAIGVITLAPVYITYIYMVEVLAPETFTSVLKLSPLPPFVIAVLGTVLISFLIFSFWCINILLTHVLDKFSIRISPRKKYLLSFVLCLLTFVSFRGIMQVIAMLFFHPAESQLLSHLAVLKNHNIAILRYILIFLFTLSANTLIYIIQNVMLLKQKEAMIESENAQLKIKNIEATYQQLKQQIHPHFLFNSLNTLKTLIRKQPEQAEVYLKKLSDFLRASVSLDNEIVIKLEEELKICMDYLDLQKVRFGDAFQFIVTIPDEVKSGVVPVFSLQQLLENAFKHNALTKASPLLIKVTYDNDRIIVSNNINEKEIAEESTGMGLANLSERYKIISDDEVIIHTDGHVFSVSLKILSHDTSQGCDTIS